MEEAVATLRDHGELAFQAVRRDQAAPPQMRVSAMPRASRDVGQGRCDGWPG
jgi:hypothetical protein